MPVCLVKAVLMSSSAFFMEAATNNVSEVWASGCCAIPAATTIAAARAIRTMVLNMMAPCGAGTHALARPLRQARCWERPGPEAPFRRQDALTARHGSQGQPNRAHFSWQCGGCARRALPGQN